MSSTIERTGDILSRVISVEPFGGVCSFSSSVVAQELRIAGNDFTTHLYSFEAFPLEKESKVCDVFKYNHRIVSVYS